MEARDLPDHHRDHHQQAADQWWRTSCVSRLTSPSRLGQIVQRAEARLRHVEAEEGAGGEADDDRQEEDRLEDARRPAAAVDEEREASPRKSSTGVMIAVYSR